MTVKIGSLFDKEAELREAKKLYLAELTTSRKVILQNYRNKQKEIEEKYEEADYRRCYDQFKKGCIVRARSNSAIRTIIAIDNHVDPAFTIIHYMGTDGTHYELPLPNFAILYEVLFGPGDSCPHTLYQKGD